MTTDLPPEELFAVDFAALAREIAMDILPLADILKLHQLDDDEWLRISEHPKFVEILGQMVTEWNATKSVRERVKIKVGDRAGEPARGLHPRHRRRLDPAGAACRGRQVPGPAGRARRSLLGANAGGAFTITFNIGEVTKQVDVGRKTIDATVIPEP